MGRQLGYNHSEETKVLQSKRAKGRVMSEVQKKKLSKAANGKSWTKARRKAHIEQRITKPKTKWTKKNNQLYHPMWNDIRKLIYKRDKYECQECGCHCVDKDSKTTMRKIQCHHIDYDTTNNDLDNLITLCASCHGKTNFKRTDWIERYSNRKVL